jgi:hypothetical protein
MWESIRQYFEKSNSDLVIVGIILLVGFGGFGLGRLSMLEEKKEPIQILQRGTDGQFEATAIYSQELQTVTGESTMIDHSSGEVVASKNGTKYHYPWCGGAGQIKEENKVWFASIEEARKAGYTPAANCKGLR